MEKSPSSQTAKRLCRWCGSENIDIVGVDASEQMRRYKCDDCFKVWWIKLEDIQMANDLFVMLNNNKYNSLVERVEGRVAELVATRHDAPMWPEHDGQMDSWEQTFHGPVRHQYYYTTILLIQTLRALRSIS